MASKLDYERPTIESREQLCAVTEGVPVVISGILIKQ